MRTPPCLRPCPRLPLCLARPARASRSSAATAAGGASARSGMRSSRKTATRRTCRACRTSRCVSPLCSSPPGAGAFPCSRVSSRRNAQRRSRQEAPAQSNHLSEDFDFGAGLASFNKHEVFEQIRVRRPRFPPPQPPSTSLLTLPSCLLPTQSNDDTDPSLRLVAHNRNPSARSHHAQTKLLPTESVLSPSELLEQRAERRDVRAMVRQQAVAASRRARARGARGARGARARGSPRCRGR